MKKLLKTILLLTLLSTMVYVPGCKNKWKRMQTVQTIALTQLSTNNQLVVFNKKGETTALYKPASMLNNINNNIPRPYQPGIRQDINNIQVKQMRNNFNAIAKLKSLTKIRILKLMKPLFEVLPTIINEEGRYVDFENENNKLKLTSLVNRSKSDAIISIQQTLGVIESNSKDSKKYELALKLKFQVADQEGFIGSQEIFVESGIVKELSNGNETFTEQDVITLIEITSKQLNEEFSVIK
tara:strand:- start:30 stop:749 length:720 start_codon:yes stop_codon:yes gene_type:complete